MSEVRNPPQDAAPAIKVGDTVFVVGKVVAECPADPPEIEAGYQVRFEGRTGSSYRSLPSSVVVPRRNITPGEQVA